MRTFILISCGMLLGAIATTVVVWFLVMQPRASLSEEVKIIATTTEPIVATTTASTPTAEDPVVEEVTVAPESTEESEVVTPEATTIDVASRLTDEQKAVAEQVGIDIDGFQITAEMATCALDVLGEERLVALTAGELPGPLETIRLLGCLGE